MVMSTTEQETFEAALSARDGQALESIKAGVSRVDVRQVRPPAAAHRGGLAVTTLCHFSGP